MVHFEQCFALFSSMPPFYSCLIFLLGCDQQGLPARPEQTFQAYPIRPFHEHILFDQKKLYKSLLNYLSKHIAASDTDKV